MQYPAWDVPHIYLNHTKPNFEYYLTWISNSKGVQKHVPQLTQKPCCEVLVYSALPRWWPRMSLWRLGGSRSNGPDFSRRLSLTPTTLASRGSTFYLISFLIASTGSRWILTWGARPPSSVLPSSLTTCSSRRKPTMRMTGSGWCHKRDQDSQKVVSTHQEWGPHCQQPFGWATNSENRLPLQGPHKI